jgi:hypothetical protein
VHVPVLVAFVAVLVPAAAEAFTAPALVFTAATAAALGVRAFQARFEVPHGGVSLKDEGVGGSD